MATSTTTAANIASIGTTISTIIASLTSAGVSSTTIPSILASIGLASAANPNKSAEMALCSQILQFAAEPQLVTMLAQKLATEQGIPPAAAALSLTLGNVGVDIPTRVIQIETIINQGV